MKQVEPFKSEIEFLKKNFFIFPVLLVMFSLPLIFGFSSYDGWFKNKHSFQELELKKQEFYLEGYEFLFLPEQHRFRTILIPSGFSSLFNGYYSHLFGMIGIDPLTLYQSLRAEDSFPEAFFDKIFFVYCAFVFLYGFGVKYSVSLSGLYGKARRKMFWFLTFFRIGVISSFFLFIMIFAVIIGAFFKVNILVPHLFAYILVSILGLIFVYAFGALFSFLKSTRDYIFPLALLLFLFIIFPNISIHKTYTFKDALQERVTNIEFFNKFLEVSRSFKDSESIPELIPGDLDKLVSDFMETNYKSIRNFERKRLEKMRKNFRDLQFFRSFSPFTFYCSVTAELSKGCASEISLFENSHYLKESFFAWNFKRRILQYTNQEKPEPFYEKGSNKNILYGSSSLPYGFYLGVFSTLFYLILLLFLAYLKFLKSEPIPAPASIG